MNFIDLSLLNRRPVPRQMSFYKFVGHTVPTQFAEKGLPETCFPGYSLIETHAASIERITHSAGVEHFNWVVKNSLGE